MLQSEWKGANSLVTNEQSKAILWMLDPSSYDGGLPYASANPAQVKVTTAYRSLNTTNYANGHVLWVPKRGYNTIEVCQDTANTAQSVNVEGGTITTNATPNLIPVYNGSNLDPAPALEETVATGRVATAGVAMYSATIGVGTAAITGEVSAFAIQDFRDINDFNPTSLQQLSETNKDNVVAVRGQNGVIAFLGPDMCEHFTPINEYDATQDGFGSKPVTVYDGAPVATTGIIYGTWLLPGYQYNLSGQALIPTGFSQLPRIPWWLAVEISVFLEAVSAPALSEGFFIIDMYYGHFDNTNSLVVRSEDYSQTFFSDGARPGYWNAKAIAKPRRHEAFLGFSIHVHHPDYVTNVRVSYRVLNLYEDRQYSVRVLSWSQMAPEQSLIIKMASAVEGGATGPIAPYVKAGYKRAIQYQAVYDVRSLFNNPETRLLCRVYNLAEWASTLGPQIIHAMPGYLSGVAGGFFEDLGSKLGTTLGAVADEAAGSLIGSAAARKRTRGMAAGMLTRGSSAGMF